MDKIETMLEIMFSYDGGSEHMEVVSVDNGEEKHVSVIEEHSTEAKDA